MKIPKRISNLINYVKENIVLEDSELEDNDYALTRKEKTLLKRQEKLEEKEEAKEQEVEELEEIEDIEEEENLEEADNSEKVRKGNPFVEKVEGLKQQVEGVMQHLEGFQKEVRIEERNEKRISLFEKLEELKTKLENEELTPLKRLLLQIQLSSIETKLDKQIAYLNIEDFKTKMQEAKNHRTQEYDAKLENINQDMDAIFDKKYEIERDIEILTKNIKEREASYQNINEATKKAKGTYEYHMNPDVLTQLEEKQKQLEEVLKQKEAKEGEITQLQQALKAKHTEIDQVKRDKLVKYNPAVIQWNTLKTFFARVKNNIKEWWGTRTLEKDAKKEAIKQAKINSKAETRRKIAEIKKNENEAMVGRFREELSSHIPLKEQQEYTEKIVQEEKSGENNESSKKEEMLEYFRKQEEAKREYRERQARLTGKQFIYQDGNYVLKEAEKEEEQTQETEQAVEQERE